MDDFCDAEFVTTTTTKKAARLGNWGGSTISSTTSSARRILVDKDRGWGSTPDWGNERGQPDGGKIGLTNAERVSSLSSSGRRLSDHSRDSGDLDDDVRSVSSTSSDRRSRRSVDTFGNRDVRPRRTANFFRDDFGETMQHMIDDFDSRFSNSLWVDDDDDDDFFRRRRRARHNDDIFNRQRLFNRNNRSRMMPTLFDSTFVDVWTDQKSNLDDEYAESGIFSDRASSRQSNHGEGELLKNETSAKRLPADKFEVDIDVHGFKANELLVRTEGRRLTITAIKKDKDGNPVPNFRELKREFVLPEGVNPYDVTSNLMPDGFLRVEAPVGGRKRPSNSLEESSQPSDTTNKQDSVDVAKNTESAAGTSS